VIPLISTLLGGRIDFTNLFIVLGIVPDDVPMEFNAVKKAGIPIFAYGNFTTISIKFTLFAIVIFQNVKITNKIREEEPKPVPKHLRTLFCLEKLEII